MEAGGGDAVKVAEAAKKKAEDRDRYLVLKQDGSGLWGIAEGASSLKEAVDKHGEGVYVQVPKRSWKPRTAKVEQVTKVVLD